MPLYHQHNMNPSEPHDSFCCCCCTCRMTLHYSILQNSKDVMIATTNSLSIINLKLYRSTIRLLIIIIFFFFLLFLFVIQQKVQSFPSFSISFRLLEISTRTWWEWSMCGLWSGQSGMGSDILWCSALHWLFRTTSSIGGSCEYNIYYMQDFLVVDFTSMYTVWFQNYTYLEL